MTKRFKRILKAPTCIYNMFITNIDTKLFVEVWFIMLVIAALMIMAYQFSTLSNPTINNIYIDVKNADFVNVTAIKTLFP